MRTLAILLLAAAAVSGVQSDDKESEGWTELKPEPVTVQDDKWRAHPLVAFCGPAGDLDVRARAHREKDEEAIAKLPPPKAGEEVCCFLLWGWNSGPPNPLQASNLEAGFNKARRTIRATFTRTIHRNLSRHAFPAVMRYVGFRLPLGPLPEGAWFVEVFEIVETCDDPGRNNLVRQPKRKILSERFEVVE